MYPSEYPHYRYRPDTTTAPLPSSITVHHSVMEQMGVDPISRLAAAIEKLADALNRDGIRD